MEVSRGVIHPFWFFSAQYLEALGTTYRGFLLHFLGKKNTNLLDSHN